MSLLLLAFGMAERAGAQDIIVYTEEYPPFNMVLADGTIGGLATRNVRQVLDASGVSYEIKLVPWVRAILFAQTEPNALIYSLTRTPAREERFDWLARLAKSDFKVFARADETRPVTFEAIQAGLFTGACVSRDLSCDLFELIGMPEDQMTVVADNITGDFRLVAAGRADLYITQASTNAQWRRDEGFDPVITVPVLDISNAGDLYLAAGPQVPQAIRDRVRASYERLMAGGQYDLINGDKAGD